MTETRDVLMIRFGTVSYYRDCFRGIKYLNPRVAFILLEEMKNKSPDAYEAARQNYLQLLGQHKMIWIPTNKNIDLNVELSSVVRDNTSDCIAFMRIRPKGFRGERVLSANMEMNFHLLIGRAVFVYRKRSRNMHRGSHVNVAPKSTYAIRCLGDEPAYFVFQYIEKSPTFTKPQPKIMAIEAPPENGTNDDKQ